MSRIRYWVAEFIGVFFFVLVSSALAATVTWHAAGGSDEGLRRLGAAFTGLLMLWGLVTVVRGPAER